MLKTYKWLEKTKLTKYLSNTKLKKYLLKTNKKVNTSSWQYSMEEEIQKTRKLVSYKNI